MMLIPTLTSFCRHPSSLSDVLASGVARAQVAAMLCDAEHPTDYTKHTTPYTLQTTHCTLHTTHYYTLYTLHINPHPKCCPHTLKARLHSRGTTSRQRTARRHTSLCTRHTSHYTLHTSHYALHTTQLTRTPHPKCVGALQSDDISLPCWCVVRCSTP